MLHASTKKLIDRLAEMTELNKLDWTEGEAGSVTYSTEGYSVSLTEAPNELVITSKDGKELERATAEDLAASPHEEAGTYASVVATMTQEAARTARGTEAAISTLLAGMDPDAEATPNTVAPDSAETEPLQEDPINETSAVGAVETEASEPDPELAGETETVDAAALVTDEAIEPEAGQADAEDMQAMAMPEDIEAAEQINTDAPDSHTDIGAPFSAQSEPAPDAPETESENEVTEAVARLATEVNEREDSGLDAAAASAMGVVALAAGLPTEAPAESTETPDESEAPADSSLANKTPSAMAQDPNPAPEPPAYVPFGLTALEPITDADETIEPAAAESDIQTSGEVISDAEPMVQSTAPEQDASDDQIEAVSEPIDQIAEADSALEEDHPEITTAAVERVDEPVEATPDAEDQGVQDTAETVLVVPTDVANDDMASEAATDKAPATDVAPTDTPESMVEASEADAPGPVETDTPTYSLNGIGAGFGLGAVTAKPESSPLPGPGGRTPPSEDKVIIDATDDVVPTSEPMVETRTFEQVGVQTLEKPADAAQSESSDSEDPDILKPRTRFNPWD
ncbi:MAG: hypothetical protein AAGA72_03710 [Pseudomonadota bacterium]